MIAIKRTVGVVVQSGDWRRFTMLENVFRKKMMYIMLLETHSYNTTYIHSLFYKEVRNISTSIPFIVIITLLVYFFFNGYLADL